MMTNRARVHLETAFELIQLDDRPVTVDVELEYDALDPYAVRIELAAPGGPRVPWVLGRELLLAGLHAPAGEGDVRLQPIAGDIALLELRSEQGQAWFHLPISQIAQFLDDSYDIVPKDQESDRLGDDFDAALHALLHAI
jgi:hypothetical protein